MVKRIITGVIALAVLLPVLFFADTPALPIALAICAVFAVFEMLSCVGLQRSIMVSIPFYLSAVAAPILIYFSKYFSTDGKIGNYTLNRIIIAMVFVTILYFFGILVFSKGKYKITDIAVAFLCTFYTEIGLFAIQYIHDNVEGGRFIYLTIFIGAWVTDTFAYFCGMLFGRKGKHKLIPEISPKKTVEGSIGGIIFCILALNLFGFIVHQIDNAFVPNYPVLSIAGLFISVVAQIGDLAFSVVKRHYGIKDFGKILPGHGGILDRFDSIIAVSVVLAVLTSFLNLFQLG